MSQTNDGNLVSLNEVYFSRGDKEIFQGININIPRGKITAIMGPSGTGKTTLLRLIGAQLTPNSGHVLFDGIDIHKQSTRSLYTLRRRMGMLFQAGALFTGLSVFENVAFPLREHTNLPEDMLRDIVLLKLESVGLRGAHDLMPASLSGGMARRVALARAIALDPELMMYDEPFTGQDPITMGVLVRLIKSLNDALCLTSIIVSHDVAETVGIADYVYVISEGKVISQGTPEELSRDKEPQVSQFMEGLADGPVPFHYPAKDFKEELLA